MIRKIANILLKRGETLSTAESCTGGMIGAACTALPGSSQWFEGCVISYSNDIKVKLLNVSAETLKKYGAVSSETVYEMLNGVIKQIGSDWAIAVSGIAGPTGGTAEKPVGTVFIGVQGCGKVMVEENHFLGNRDEVRGASVDKAFEMLLNLLEQ